MLFCLLFSILLLVFWSSFHFFSVNTAESAFKHLKKTHEAVNEMGNKHVSAVVSHIRLVVLDFLEYRWDHGKENPFLQIYYFRVIMPNVHLVILFLNRASGCIIVVTKLFLHLYCVFFWRYNLQQSHFLLY